MFRGKSKKSSRFREVRVNASEDKLFYKTQAHDRDFSTNIVAFGSRGMDYSQLCGL